MTERIGEKIKLISAGELLGVGNEESAITLDIGRIKGFQNHPFHVQMDTRMKELIESIRANGILTPVLVRPSGDGYEMISGHRRMYAAKQLGIKELPAIIRDMTDEEATIIMVDSNIQREEILPSEKAFAYKMKLEAMKKQGQRSDLTSDQNDRKLESADILAKEVEESKAQVRRYIRLTKLIPELLNLVDEKRLQLMTAVEFSHLDKTLQMWLNEYLYENGTINVEQAKELRKLPALEIMTKDEVFLFLNGKHNSKKSSEKVTFKFDKLKKYFPENYTSGQMEEVILQLLEEWNRKGD